MDLDTILGLTAAFALFGTLMYIIFSSVKSKNKSDEAASLGFLKTNGVHYHIKPDDVEIITKKYIREVHEQNVKDDMKDFAIETGKNGMMQVEMELSQILVRQEHDGEVHEFFTPVYHTRASKIENMLALNGGIDLYVNKSMADSYSFSFPEILPD